MSHRLHRRHSKRKFKHLAAAVAGAAIMSSALLPGLPATIAHASANPNLTPPSTTPAIHQVVKKPISSFTPATTDRQKSQPNSRHHYVAKVPTNAADQRSPQVQARTKADPMSRRSQSTQAASTKAPTNFNQVLNIKATAYAPGAHDNEQWGNKTFSGTEVRPGIIAVDPNIIPLGSRVYIEYPDGTGAYATAEDTGGAIKGNRIDIAMQSVGQAENFGIQNVKVYVLDKQA